MIYTYVQLQLSMILEHIEAYSTYTVCNSPFKNLATNQYLKHLCTCKLAILCSKYHSFVLLFFCMTLKFSIL